MTSPQGWYPDPGGSAGLRWYDGERWTEHVAPLAPPPSAAGAKATHTPDGQPLADWGSRLGAYVIDTVIVGIASGLLGLPWLVDVFTSTFDQVEANNRAIASGGTPDLTTFLPQLTGGFLLFGLVALAVSVTYHVGLWRTRGASVGMLLVGLRVRTWEPADGPLPWRVALVRWGAFYGVGGVLGLVPVVGWFASTYVWAAGLWPLWDARRQGLHDKAAGTVVVRA